jgi:hypothetical protein
MKTGVPPSAKIVRRMTAFQWQLGLHQGRMRDNHHCRACRQAVRLWTLNAADARQCQQARLQRLKEA